MTRKLLSLLVALALLVMPCLTLAEEYQTYVSEDESVAFLYPSDWILLSRENIDTIIDAAATVEDVAELAQIARTQIEQLGIIVLMDATGANNINFQHQNAGVALSGDDLMNLAPSLQSNISASIDGVSFYDPELMDINGTDAMLLQYTYAMAGIDFTGLQVYMPVGTELAICTLTSSCLLYTSRCV